MNKKPLETLSNFLLSELEEVLAILNENNILYQVDILDEVKTFNLYIPEEDLELGRDLCCKFETPKLDIKHTENMIICYFEYWFNDDTDIYFLDLNKPLTNITKEDILNSCEETNPGNSEFLTINYNGFWEEEGLLNDLFEEAKLPCQVDKVITWYSYG